MTIRRTAVLWLGAAPPSRMDKRLSRRGLTLVPTSMPSDVNFRTACSVVFNARGKSGGSLRHWIGSYAETALRHGLRVVIRLAGPNVALVQRMFPTLTDRFVYLDPTVTDGEGLAEILRFEGAGLAENDTLFIPPLKPPLQDEDKLLLRCAFGDCELLTLSEITEGKSSARVLRVHAKLAGADPPAYLLPFLVKIDAIPEIQCEIDRYRQFVQGHIPFTQRPNLEPRRCVTGARRAVMVSDFVEDAVSLTAVCQRPDGRRIVYSLFDDALRSWRRHAFADAPTPPMPITAHLGEILQVNRISPAVRDRAARWGLKQTPEELVAELENCGPYAFKLGTIHGDLHPGNVMVRAGEAIVIDFASIWNEKKPLVADLACLEVGMCFTVAPEGCVRSPTTTRRHPFTIWRKAVDDLFSLTTLQRIPPQQEPGGLSWLADACRQTRTLAGQLEATPGAYAAALAVYLLRRARLGGSIGTNPSIEAYALRTAGKVIMLLKSGKLDALS